MSALLDSAVKGLNALIFGSSSLNDFLKDDKNPNKDVWAKKLKEIAEILNANIALVRPILDITCNEGYGKMCENNAKLVKENRELRTQNDKWVDYSNVCGKVEEMFQGWKDELTQDFTDWKKAGDTVDTTVQTEVKEAVKDHMKDIMTETVNTIVNTKKIKDTFADVLKNSEGIIAREAKKGFNKSLTSALKESQSEIISQTAARQESDSADKEKRIRNVVITTVPESTLTEIKDRVAADKLIAAELLDVAAVQIERCYRAGPPLGTGSNKDRSTPRPLVVVLATPELARSKHKYGNGSKVLKDGAQFWVNPDLSRAERRANFEARQKRRERMTRSVNGQNNNAENSGNVATT